MLALNESSIAQSTNLHLSELSSRLRPVLSFKRATWSSLCVTAGQARSGWRRDEAYPWTLWPFRVCLRYSFAAVAGNQATNKSVAALHQSRTWVAPPPLPPPPTPSPPLRFPPPHTPPPLRHLGGRVWRVPAIGCVCVGLSACRHYIRGQELCESPAGRPGLPVPNRPYCLSVDVKQQWKQNRHYLILLRVRCWSVLDTSGYSDTVNSK